MVSSFSPSSYVCLTQLSESFSSGGPRSETLQKVSLQIKSQEDCKSNFGNRAPGGIVDHFICASAPGKDSCGVRYVFHSNQTLHISTNTLLTG